MEIGNQRIRHLETVAGVNEYARIVGYRMNDAVIVRRAFKNSAGGRSDREKASAAVVYNVSRFL